MLSTEKQECQEWLLMALVNILTDRMLLDEWCLIDSDQQRKTFILSELRKESNTVLSTSFQDILKQEEVMDSIQIKRPDFLSILLFFTLHSNPSLQRDCLLFLHGLLMSHMKQVNLIAVTSPSLSLVDHLLTDLENYAPENVDLVLSIIECVAKHNMTVQQLKKIFRLLHTQGDHRAKYADSILRMLNALYRATDRSRPDHSYLLIPPASGIRLMSQVNGNKIPGIPRFPAGGYALSMWFNVRSLAADWIMKGGRSLVMSRSIEFSVPHLLSVIDSRSSLFLVIQNASMVVKYYQDGKEVAVCDTNLPVSENRWYHLVLSHIFNRVDRSRSTLSLALDGMCNFKCS